MPAGKKRRYGGGRKGGRGVEGCGHFEHGGKKRLSNYAGARGLWKDEKGSLSPAGRMEEPSRERGELQWGGGDRRRGNYGKGKKEGTRHAATPRVMDVMDVETAAMAGQRCRDLCACAR